MLVEVSPATYLLLCALVKEGLMQESDATPLLKRAASELGSATSGMVSSELMEQPEHMEHLRRAGFAGR